MMKKEFRKKFPIKKVINLSIIILALLVGIYFQWGWIEIAFFLIFISIILHPISSRILAIPALFFLVCTPFLLIFDKEILAEDFAIYAYYFFVMSVIMGVYEVWKKDKKEDGLEEKQ